MFRGGIDSRPIEPATRLAEGEVLGHTSPHFLSDGRHFIYLSPHADESKSALYLASLGSFERRLLLTGVTDIGYAPPDYLLFVRGGVLLSQKFDLARRELRGEAKRAAAPPRAESIAAFSASANGMLVLQFGETGIRSDLVWRGRDGDLIGPAAAPGMYRQVSLSPDETSAALNLQKPGGESGIDVLRFDKQVRTAVVSSRERILDGIWSPDSRSLAYQVYGSQKTRIFIQALDGSAPKAVLDDGNSNYPDDWSPDGRHLLCRRTGNTVVTVAPDGSGAPPKVLLAGEHVIDQLKFSPDGKWIAYNSDESGRWEVYVARFPGMGPHPASNPSGRLPAALARGRQRAVLSRCGRQVILDGSPNGRWAARGAAKPVISVWCGCEL